MFLPCAFALPGLGNFRISVWIWEVSRVTGFIIFSGVLWSVFAAIILFAFFRVLFRQLLRPRSLAPLLLAISWVPLVAFCSYGQWQRGDCAR